jgi:mannosyltransferase
METHAATAGARVGARAARISAVRSVTLWLVGLTAAGVALRFATLGLQSYHHDEVITAVRVLPGNFAHMMREVRTSESTPPLYYIVAWGWSKLFGLGETQLRSLSALVGAASIPIAYLIGRELAGRRAGLIATALVAVNPMLIWYSQEARAYSLLAFFCGLSLLFFLRLLHTQRRREFALWAVFSSLALATHYFAVFPLAIESIWLLVALRGGKRSELALGLGLIAAVGIGLMPLMLHQANLSHTDWIARDPLLGRLWDSLVSFQIGETGNLIGEHLHPAWALLPGVGLVLALGSLAFNRGTARLAIPGLAVGFGAIGLALLAAAGGQDFVLGRNLLPALIPILCAAAVAMSRLRGGMVLAGLLCVYFVGFSVLVDVEPDLQRPDWRAVAADLGPAKDRRVIVTWALGAAPLTYYLDDGTTRTNGGEPIKVRELDLISDTGATPDTTPPTPAFSLLGTDREHGLTVVRYRASRPVRLSYRGLRHLPTGFPANFVLVGKPAAAPGLTPGLGGGRRAAQGRGLLPGHGPGAAARMRFRRCAARSSRSGPRRSAHAGERQARPRSLERGHRRGARSNRDSKSLRPRADRAHRAARARAAGRGSNGQGSGHRHRRHMRACLRTGSA